ncbi:MAG TPA: carboxylesterase family protein, partial [Candidatus Obscuribacterales bacterium]
ASPNGTGRYYDGRNLAASGPVVVVTLNYRLGALGFLAHPALATADGYMGNYGLLDQLEALRWIQRNIKSFGGDPDRVMVFGQSAGAIDLSALLVSPLSKGLFSRAAMQSGVCTIVSADSAEHTARQVQSLVGAGDASDVAAALRAVPAEILVRLPGASVASNNSLGLEFGPVLDRHLLPASPLAAIRRGTHMHMPILMGTTSEEYVPDWLVELVAGAQVRTEHEYILATERLWGAGAASVRRVYSAARYASAQDALAEALSDALMCAPTRRFARALAEAQCEPVWCYVFDRPGASGRAGHGDDIPFIFQSCAVPDDGQDLAMQMAKYWTTFAATGNPNHNAAPAWPQYSALRDRVLLIAREIGVAERFRSRMLDLWDAADAG